MTLDDFRTKLQEQSLLVAYFSHNACNVCKVLKPQVRELVSHIEGTNFLYVNTKESLEVAGQYMVFAVPTIILFLDNREIRRFSRHFSLKELSDFLNKLNASTNL